MNTTPEERDRLKALTAEATPGPWKVGPPSHHKSSLGPNCKQPVVSPTGTVANTFKGQERVMNPERTSPVSVRALDTPLFVDLRVDDPDASYIAAANPDLISRLLADVEAQAALAEARLKALRDLYKADTGPSFDPLIQARAEARRLLNEADEASDGE